MCPHLDTRRHLSSADMWYDQPRPCVCKLHMVSLSQKLLCATIKTCNTFGTCQHCYALIAILNFVIPKFPISETFLALSLMYVAYVAH